MLYAIRRGIESPTPNQKAKPDNGVWTPGAASPTLSVVQ